MIGSYEDWQNMAVQMRSERDKALDELSEERERYELLAGDYAGADTDRKQLAKALEKASALLVRWCRAFSMGPLADQYLRQESKTFLISNYPKHKP